MTHPAAYPHYQWGFAQFQTKPSKRVRKGKEAREDFVPTEQQELTAVDRIEGRLKNCPKGSHHTEVFTSDYACNSEAALQEEALRRAANQLVPYIHSRGNELGRGRWEFEATLLHALRRGIRDGKFEFSNHAGEVTIRLKAWRVARQQRYRNRPNRGTSRAA